LNLRSDDVKSIASMAGSALCGIASVDRFAGAPQGFHPADIFPRVRSVAVVAIRFPEGPFHAHTLVPYTAANDALMVEMTRMLCRIALDLEKNSTVEAVPVPGEPYEYWDEKKQEGRGILSLKHAGHLAGLGALGRNTLLVNPQFGNRIVLGALLLDAALESDRIIEDGPCKADCRLCMDACPVNAIAEVSVNQKRCRRNSGRITPKGYSLYTCCRCRQVCPNATGFEPFRNGESIP